MQRNCIFPGRYAPLTYYDWLRGRPRNTLMARNAREIWLTKPWCVGLCTQVEWTAIGRDGLVRL